MPRSRLGNEPGRPRVRPLRTGPGSSPVDRTRVGIDVGATKILWAVGSSTGRLLRSGELRFHGNESRSRVLDETVQAAEEALATAPAPPPCLGVGVAAQVDAAGSSVVHAPNLGWRNVPLARLLSRRLSVPVRLVNDAQAAVFGEWKFGAGRGCANVFLMSLGTGIGGGAVVDGRLLRGARASAAEIGHLTVVSAGRRCHCGNVGCLEAHAGGWALAEQAREAVRASPRRGVRLLERAGDLRQISARTVVAAARAGDPLARELLRANERFLSDGAVSVANAFNPERIVLVGGLVAGRPELVRTLGRAVRGRCQPPAAFARVVRGRLDPYATALGAAAWALEP